MSNVAVVVVDVQRDFLDPTACPAIATWQKAFCVHGVHRLLDYARTEGWRIIHVGTKHDSAATLPLHQRVLNFPLYCEAGTAGCEFVLKPESTDTVRFKTWYSAFDAGLNDALGGIDILVWAGVATNCCVQQSAFDADRLGLQSVIPLQAVSASSIDAFSASLTALGKSAARIADLDELLAGGDLTTIAIDIGEITGRSEQWFTEQEARLGDVVGLSLEQVLQRLGSSPHP